jgi:hypothetical protein
MSDALWNYLIAAQAQLKADAYVRAFHRDIEFAEHTAQAMDLIEKAAES